MSVWLCIPSARPPEQANAVLSLWRQQGYKIALWRDPGASIGLEADIVIAETYAGYCQAANRLIKFVLDNDSTCNWVVTGGDDVEPDANHTAEEIAAQCRSYFRKHHYGNASGYAPAVGELATFGVMQPTGDRWGDTPMSRDRFGEDRGANADRVCGSPWIGREFAQRINQGRGPLWPEYTHMFEDEELFHVAQRLGVLWQRRDLIQFHRHWARGADATVPEFLREANSAEHWQKYGALFKRRQMAGFPGHEPL